MSGAMQQLRIVQASLNRDRDPYRSGGLVDMDTSHSEGGAAATKVDWRRPLPCLFLSRRRRDDGDCVDLYKDLETGAWHRERRYD